MQNERIINSQTSNKMSSIKNLLNHFGILFHIILIGVAIFKTNSHAATPFEQVEEAVGGGAIYLDLVGIDTTYESITNSNVSLTTDALDWGWPDGSDGEVSVASDGFSGDIFDDKSNTASDFSTFISGLTPF